MEISAELRAAAWRELSKPTMAFDRCPGPDSVGRQVGGNRRALAWIIDENPSTLAMDNERFLMARDNNMPPRGGYNPGGIVGGEDGGYYPAARARRQISTASPPPAAIKCRAADRRRHCRPLPG